MKIKQSKVGLTLVELLIVITIIGLLATIFGINVGKWRARARDSQRVADIRTLQQGLAFYFFRSDYSGSYPVYDIYITGSDVLSQDLQANGSMSTVPADPLNEGNYRYHYCSLQSCTSQTDGVTYYLEYWLETSAIPGKSQGQNFAGP
jgi:prepilin-type N-terminal cleavage/methylation domain-containing protein